VPDVALERGEMFLCHLPGAMGFERSPALGATHLDRVAPYPIRHRFSPGPDRYNRGVPPASFLSRCHNPAG